MSSRSRPSRAGLVAVLGALVALVAGYLNDCFVGFGLSPGTGSPPAAAPVASEKSPAAASGKLRVVVQGEQCRLDDATTLRDCAGVCAEPAAGATVEVEATAGAQRAVEALRTCLQGRGVKVQVVSE